jgi:hypothetical protein
MLPNLTLTALALLLPDAAPPAPKAARPAILILPGVVRVAGPSRRISEVDFYYLQAHAALVRQCHGHARADKQVLALRCLPRPTGIAWKDQGDQARWLAHHLRVQIDDQEGLLRVSFGAGTPTEQATIVNAIVAAYQRHPGRPFLKTRLRWIDAGLRDIARARPDAALPGRLRDTGLGGLLALTALKISLRPPASVPG